MLLPQPSILFIDAYDSFTNNIISLLTTTLSCSVRVIHIDSPVFETDKSLNEELQNYDAIVCGPGPGDPTNEKDVGLMNRIWQLSHENIVPVLGICLGFQSLAVAFGGTIKVLPDGLHGIVKRIRYTGEGGLGPKSDLFRGVGEVWATLYHSLYIDLGQDALSIAQWKEESWNVFPKCPDLEALAWVHPVNVHDSEQTGMKNGPILTAVRHKVKPFYGLQYHPESICTNQESRKIIRNWFASAQRWNRDHNRIPRRDQADIKGILPIRRSLLSNVNERKKENPFWGVGELLKGRKSGYHHESKMISPASIIIVPDVVRAISLNGSDIVLLESSNSHIQGKGAEDVRGRYSIIGVEVDHGLQIKYQVGNEWASVRHARESGKTGTPEQKFSLTPYGGIWQFLAAYLEERKIDGDGKDLPFLGGFIGYTTYELGLEGINVQQDVNPRKAECMRHDLCFAWIKRSLVIDHKENKIYVQQLVNESAKEDAWLDTFTTYLQKSLETSKTPHQNVMNTEFSLKNLLSTPTVTTPNIKGYESKVRSCQDSIRKGDSYELCLTDQTHVTIPHKVETAWNLYNILRSRQPAPFGSFIRLGDATFVSSSPERFLTWSSNNLCSLRPMKGTVRKSTTISTLAQATALLNVPKERAENLMIVDLVRHDLHSVCGSGNVSVPRLMVVEEYASVFQMVSVVEGQIPRPAVADELTTLEEADYSRRTRHTGIDVLAASLPPGSMTGAPKKRSCELLSEIEGHSKRSLYSGVVGYMDVTGRGDFSVNIRCMFRWDDEIERQPSNGDEKETEELETWHIGAGGAVTGLSEAQAEREEMQTKLAGTLGVFGVKIEREK